MGGFLDSALGVLGGLTNIGSNAVGAWATVKGFQENKRVNDLNFQLEKENLAYQKNLQNIMFAREDNAVQRRVNDLKSAGLSPVLAAGSAASSGPVIGTSAPQKISNLQGYMALAQIGTMLAQQQRAQTEADIAMQNLKQSKISTETQQLDLDYLKKKGLAPVEVSQDWQQRLVNLIYPKLEAWLFGDEDEGKAGIVEKIVENWTSPPVDLSKFKEFDKEIPVITRQNGDKLYQDEYKILSDKNLVDTWVLTGWSPWLKEVVFGK